MVLQEYQPGSFLAAFVRTYRIDSRQAIPAKAYPPRPEHCLSFYPRDVEAVEFSESGKKEGGLKAVVFGQQTEVTNRFVGNDFLLFQIVFKPGGLFRLTGVPSYEIVNSYLDADLFFPGQVELINEQLNECKDYRQMVLVVEAFLQQHILKKNIAVHRVDQACDMLFKNTATYSVDWVAKQSALSVRQFERVFKERMGISPKYYIKIARFENAFRMKNQSPGLDWLTIALHCGYYDYQHLVKDYKALTRMSPTEFHEVEKTAPERIFGEVDTY